MNNVGDIAAPRGRAVLAAAREVLLHDTTGDDRISVRVADGTVTNSGSIEAAAAELRAAGGNVYALAIQNSGVIRATTVDRSGGRIVLRADAGVVRLSGTLDASAAEGLGGDVTVAADNIAIDDARLLATGTTRGGEIRVGTDCQAWDDSLLNDGFDPALLPNQIDGAHTADAVLLGARSVLDVSDEALAPADRSWSGVTRLPVSAERSTPRRTARRPWRLGRNQFA